MTQAATSGVKFPQVKVKLVGEDGNAFAIMGRVLNAMKKAGVSKEDRDAYIAEAQSGDYDHLLQVTMRTVVECDGPDGDECGNCGQPWRECECD